MSTAARIGTREVTLVPEDRSTLPTFLDHVQPVEFVARLESHRVDGPCVIMSCSTHRHEPQLQDYYGTVCETVFDDPVPGRPATVRADFWGPAVIRLRYCPADDVVDTPVPALIGGPAAISPMVVNGPPTDPAELSVTEHADRIVVASTQVSLTIVREPWQLLVRNGAGDIIFATKPVDIDGLRRAEHQWDPPQQRWLFLHRYAYPLGSTVGEQTRAAFASFDLRHDERIVGFGESFGRLDKVGSTQHLWIQETFGNASPASYKQVPLYLSNRGHAVFVHTSNAARVDVGSRDHSALSVTVQDTESLDLFVLAGRPDEVLPRYTALTGAPAVPPQWSFGFWLGRISYSSQQEVEDVADELRRRRIPADVVHIDTGWFERDYTCDLTFSPTRFPDPRAMVERLRGQGLRVCLWQWPNYNVASPLFDEGVAGGFLAKRPSGHTHTYAGGYGEDAALIDFSDPDAVRWYQDKLGALFDLGIAAIKADYGEGAPATARYRAVAAESMHNLYPLLYQDAVWQATRRSHGDDAVIWARSGWAGSQRYPVHWSGDGVSRFEDLACVLRAMLSVGLSGFCFYSHDLGGFSGNPSPELYARWLQLATFSSHIRAHGSPPREPWAFGAAAEDLTRRYLGLRYRLLPYLYSAAIEGAAASLPVVRALVLHDPDDPICWTIEDQYLFGPDLLVAPVLAAGVSARRVYLPHGVWFDYWTGARLTGGRFLQVDAAPDVLPLFVRSGAMVAMGPDQQFVGERPCDPLDLHFWGPPGDGERTVHLDREHRVAVRWRSRDGELTLDVTGAPGAVRTIRHAG